MTLENGNIQQLFGQTASGSMLKPLEAVDLRPGQSFADALNQLRGVAANPDNSNPTNQTSLPTTADDLHAKAVKAATGLVSSALILPVLKQVRHDPFGQNTIFSPGTGEKTFGPEFDMQIADRIAQSPKMGATQQLTKLLEKHFQTQPPIGQSKAAGQSKVERVGVNIHG